MNWKDREEVREIIDADRPSSAGMGLFLIVIIIALFTIGWGIENLDKRLKELETVVKEIKK